MFGRHSFNGFLNHVIPILILHALQHVMLKLLDELCLLISENVLKSLEKVS